MKHYLHIKDTLKVNKSKTKENLIYESIGGRKLYKKIIWCSFVSYVGTYCLPMLVPFPSRIQFYGNIISFFAFLFFWNILMNSSLKHSVASYIMAGIYSIILVAGSQISLSGILPMRNVEFYISILVYSYIGAEFIDKLIKIIEHDHFVVRDCDKHSFYSHAKIWVLIFLAWIPIWLALYPGAFVYDACAAFSQVFTGKFTAHHPILHTLFLGGIVKKIGELFGNYNIGIATYCLLQMILVSGVLSYVVVFLKKEGASNRLIKETCLWYALFPVISITAGCTTKDVLFTIIVLLDVILLYKYLNNESFVIGSSTKKMYFILINSLFLMMRTTAPYIFIVFVPAILLYVKGKKRIFLFKAFACIYVIYALYTGPFYSAMQVVPVDARVAFSIPIQQLSKVYSMGGEISEAEQETLFEILPQEAIETYYLPHLADPLNGNFNIVKFKETPLKYTKLWVKVGINNSIIYLSSFLDNNLAYWYPGALIDGYTQYYQVHQGELSMYKNSSYFAPLTEEPGYRDSKIPKLERLIYDLTLNYVQRDIPIISMLFSAGFLFCILLFAIFYNYLKKKYDETFILCFIFLVVLACFVGPVALLRYCLILFYSLPLIIYWIVSEKKVPSDKIDCR